MYKKLILLMPLIFVMFLSVPAQGELINRYSFNDGDTAAIDSISGKDGTLEGTATISGNKLVLDGDMSGAVHLPSDVLSPGLISVTIEAWFQDDRTQNNWSRLFDFGETNGGDGGNGMFLPAQQYGTTRFTVATNGTPSWATGEDTVSGPIFPGVETHVACVWDGPAAEIRIYINGQLAESAPTTMDLAAVVRENAYIGEASYPGDPHFMGSVNEFRIYDTALTDDEVLNSFDAGPDSAGCVELDGIAFEAESANPLTAPMEKYADDVLASGGEYIGAAPGNASTGASPAPDGTASYNFSVPATGTYKVIARMKISPTTYDDDSCWFRIDGAAQNSGAGWVKCNGLADGHLLGSGDWKWITLYNDDDGRVELEFTVDAGQHTLEVAYREDGLYFDAFLITDNLALDPATLPAALPAPCGVILEATKPDPRNGTVDLPRGAMLSWEPGSYAGMHDVYFGSSEEDVKNGDASVLVSAGQTDTFYDVHGLEYGTTYFWRVDGVNTVDMTVYPGKVWRFSTKAIGLIIPTEAITATASSTLNAEQVPENTINLSGLDADDIHSDVSTDMWLSANTADPDKAWIQYDLDQLYKVPRMLIWNYNDTGFFSVCAMKEITIEYSSDGGETWTVLEGVPELQQSNPNPEIIDFGGVADGLIINAVRITANSNFGAFPLYGLSEVRFYYVDVWPKDPVPADGTTGVDYDTFEGLSWTPGEGVVEHVVYFSADEQAVIDGTAPSAIVTDPSLDVDLTVGTQYFWRVEEVNMSEVWSGPVWSFTVRDYRVVDNFEGYTDNLQNWSNGSSRSANGAAVSLGSLARTGDQSMQFMYDNTLWTSTASGYSQTSVNPSNLDAGSNWLAGGCNYLVFWIYGDMDNADTEQMYVKIGSRLYRNIHPLSKIKTQWWTQVTILLPHGGGDLMNLGNFSIGFGRNAREAGTGVIHVDDLRLYAVPPVGETVVKFIEAESGSVTQNMLIITDDPNEPDAYGGGYIESPGSRGNAPDPNATATYNFTVAGGQYMLYARVKTNGFNDSAYWMIDDGNNIGDMRVHSSGRLDNETWIRSNGLPGNPNTWTWVRVFSDSDSSTLVFDLAPGAHTLKISRREEETKIDAIIITDDLYIE